MGVLNFQNFSSIKIGTNPVNTFAGMAIYSASFNVSPGTPTKLTIRCVEGQIGSSVTLPKVGFPPAVGVTYPNVSTNAAPVWIGPLYCPEMYLLSKESNTTAGARVMTLTFIDKSILLDKIFVGLIGQHSSYNDQKLKHRLTVNSILTWQDIKDLNAVNNISGPTTGTTYRNYAPPTDPVVLAGQKIQTLATKIPVVMTCEPCNDEVYAAARASRPPKMRTISGSILKLIDHGRIVNVNHFFGGKIILGVDQMTSRNTDLAETDYNFTELLTAMAEAWLIPLDMTRNKTFWRMLGWVDKNPQYRVKHVGTLRQVLDNFAAEFGFMYFWDFGLTSYSRCALRAIDLTMTSQINVAMNHIKSLIYDPPEGVGFDNINESQSLEGTKVVHFQGYYRKPAKPKQYQRKVQYRQIYQVVDPYDLFEGMNGGRNRDEFAISCALAKYNKNARTIYNFIKLPFHRGGTITPGMNLEHLGLNVIATVTAEEIADMLDADFSVTEFSKIIDRYGISKDSAGKANVQGLICTYSKQMEAKWERFESAVASMYGKYYLTEDVNSYKNSCGITEKWERDIQIQPAGTKVTKGDLAKLPFLNIIESHPAGRAIAGKVTGNFWRINDHSSSFMCFGRNAPWGSDQTQFESAFVHSGVDFLEQLTPVYIKLAGKTKLRFFDRIKEVLDATTSSRMISVVQSRDHDAQIVLVLMANDQFVNGGGANDGTPNSTKAKFEIKEYGGPLYKWDVINSAGDHEVVEENFGCNDAAFDWRQVTTKDAEGNTIVQNTPGGVGGWNNPNEYAEKDERDNYPICEETYYERDNVKEICECPSEYGYLPTGTRGKVPLRTEKQDEQLSPILAPRAGCDYENWTYPWKDWGARYADKTVVNNYSFAQANSMFWPDQTKVKRDHLYAPFIKDFKQQENKLRYGTSKWYLSDRENKWESRHHIHWCRGFRLYSYLPGVSGGSPTTGPGIYYHPTGSGFIGPMCSVDVIFPSENWYLGVKNENVTYTKTVPGTKQVRGDIGHAGHTMQTEVNSVDMTQDFDSISDPAGNSIVNVTVPHDPFSTPGQGGYVLDQIDLDEYWRRLKYYSTNTTVSLPQEQLSFRQFGTSPALIGFASAAYGLTNLTVTLDQDGSYLDYAFSTRPAKLPAVDSLKLKIGPALNMNMIR